MGIEVVLLTGMGLLILIGLSTYHLRFEGVAACPPVPGRWERIMTYLIPTRIRKYVLLHHSGGFTLMELLVVVTIIVILASMLMPSLRKARQQAKYGRWVGYSNNLRCDDRLVAYYDFKESEGNKLKNKAVVGPYGDHSYAPEKLHGSISGATRVRDGGRWPGKKTLEFNGTSSDYVDCGNDAAVNFGTDAFTLCAWIKTNGSGVHNILCKGEQLGSKYTFFSFYIESTFLKLRTRENSVYAFNFGGSTPINDDRWHYVCAVVNDTTSSGQQTARLYVDGAEYANSTVTGVNCSCNGNLFMGIWWDVASLNFVGSIDEVEIYKWALTENDIKNHYKMGRP